MNELLAAQSYITTWLLRFDNDLFGILYRDINAAPQELATQVFKHKRLVSIYGVRGIGKTTLMQAILWHGLQNSKGKFLPVNVGVVGANSISNQADLEDKFYRAVLSGLISAGSLKDKHNKIKSTINSHVPWLSSSAVATAGLIFPPIAVGSGITQKAVQKLLDKLGIKGIGDRSLVINKTHDPKMAVDFILEELNNADIYPVFVIDELDKVPNDKILSDFFNGNQGWFQDKQAIILVSHIFGQSVEEKIIESLGRFSQAQKIEGPTTVEQFKNVLHARLLLGISKIEPNESRAIKIIESIFPDEIIEQIVNRYVPNMYLMLEYSYLAIQKARLRKGTQVTIDDLEKYEVKEIREPTELEMKILNYLSTKSMSPKEIIEKSEKNRGTITKILKSLYSDNFIEKTGEGKNMKYSITQKGDVLCFQTNKKNK